MSYRGRYSPKSKQPRVDAIIIKHPTNGTGEGDWRITADGEDLIKQKKVSGTWTEAQRISGS